MVKRAMTALDDEIDIEKLTETELAPSQKEIAPLAVFLASSLNVELVYIILKAIT